MSAPEIVLVVEDNEDDVYFMRRALKAAAPSIPVYFVENGKDALAYLRGTEPFTNRVEYPFPSTVFIDLKLPFLHGLEVLAAIRRDPRLQDLRLFVLTSSAEERDRSRAQELGVQGYFIKPPTRALLETIFGPTRGPGEIEGRG